MNRAAIPRIRQCALRIGGAAALAAALGNVGCRARGDDPRRHEATQSAPGLAPSRQHALKPIAEDAIDPEATQFEYPYPTRVYAFRGQRQELRMAYIDVVAATPNGRTVVLLHGKNFGAHYWGATIAALSAAGFRVIAPDQIGFGKSSKPDSHQYSFVALATYTRALLTSLGVETAAVVGHSMGGMLAIRYALSYPDETAKLILVNPIGLEDYAAHVPYRSVDEWYERELALTPEKIREYQKSAYYAGTWKPEYELLTALQSGWTRHPDYARVAWSSALTYDMIQTQPVVHELGRIRVPTALIIGQRDRTAIGRDAVSAEVAARLGDYPKLGRATARAIPGAKLVELDGVGHVPMIEAFERYRDALLEILGSGVPPKPAPRLPLDGSPPGPAVPGTAPAPVNARGS